MNLTWWEWEEMEAAILERPDLWQPLEDKAQTYFKIIADAPVYVLQARGSGSTSQFRLMQINTQPMKWSQDEVDSHLIYMREKFTSFSFRQDVEAFLKDDLKQEPTLAHKAAIIIARMQQGPITQAATANVESVSLDTQPKFHVREGGVFTFRQQGEMLRCHMELSHPHVYRGMVHGYIPLILDGFMRVRGTSMQQAIEFLTQDRYITPSVMLHEGSAQEPELPLESA